MSASNHKVFVLKKDLTSRGLSPSSAELYDLMHLTTCEHAERRWRDEWTFCPVCLVSVDSDGVIEHRERKDILV